jgi:hypothetical protein
MSQTETVKEYLRAAMGRADHLGLYPPGHVAPAPEKSAEECSHSLSDKIFLYNGAQNANFSPNP